MIELDGIYKLKKINSPHITNDDGDYKVIAISDDKKTVVCEKITEPEKGEHYFFMTDFLIDPDNPNEIYTDFIITETKE